MATQVALVTGTDFVAVATRDIDRAERFYRDLLGLPLSKRWGRMPAAEFETGTLTLAVMQSDAFGMEFRPNNHPIALRVDDVAAARANSSRGAFGSRPRSSTPASATRRSLRIPTATC